MKTAMILALGVWALCGPVFAQTTDTKPQEPPAAAPAPTAPPPVTTSIFPRDAYQIVPVKMPVTYQLGWVKTGQRIATVPFTFAEPIRLTGPVTIYLMMIKTFNMQKAGDYGFLVPTNTTAPFFICLFTEDFGGTNCYHRLPAFRKLNPFMRVVTVNKPIPSDYTYDHNDKTYMNWPEYEEDVTLPHDFTMSLYVDGWSKTGDAYLLWRYNDQVVYEQMAPAGPDGVVRLSFAEGTLKVSRNPADKKTDVVAFEPATPAPAPETMPTAQAPATPAVPEAPPAP